MRSPARFLLCVLFGALSFPAAAQDDLPAAIKALLQDHIEIDKKGVGMVVGIIDEHGSTIVSCGHRDTATTPEITGDTLFDICSITKTFTAILLQDMVARGQMKLDDPVAKYLPNSVKVPTRNGKQITLRHLATHTSGLPRDLDNLSPQNWQNPYADYTPDKFYAFLSSLTLHQDPGEKFEYSSLGMQLLAHAIELKSGVDYETLVTDRICRPLKMDSTRITLTPELKARLAIGHNPPNQSVPEINFAPLLGAGGLRSTANDLLKYISANLGLTKSPLTPIMEQTHAVQIPHVDNNMDTALGWSVAHFPGAEFISHSGRGIGYRALIAFDKQRRRGVVVVSNSYDDDRLYDIGWLLLQSKWQTDKRPKAVPIDYRIYDTYTGQYNLAPDSLIGIRRQGNRLLIQPAGKLTAELLPESETDFFGRITGRKVTFARDAHGQVTRLIVHADGVEYPALKISNDPPPLPALPKPHVAISLDPKQLDALIGRYEITPAEIIIIKRTADHLLAIWGGEAFEFSPESATTFFSSYGDLQITFTTDDKGAVTGLTSHQSSEKEQHARKL